MGGAEGGCSSSSAYFSLVRYRTVLDACSLWADIAQFEALDRTMVGEKVVVATSSLRHPALYLNSGGGCGGHITFSLSSSSLPLSVGRDSEWRSEAARVTCTCRVLP